MLSKIPEINPAGNAGYDRMLDVIDTHCWTITERQYKRKGDDCLANIIDKGAKERAYNAAYRLQTADGVKRLLADRHRIGARRFKGDEDASVLLLDLDKAMTMARLTDRQAMAIALVYGLGLTHAEAAAELGITRQAVGISIDSAAKRIARIYKRWRYSDVEITLEDEAEAVCV